jgi:hypothetical protein
MILRILDWLYCWTATFCLCMVRGIAPTRPSCHWMCGQTIVSILVRLVFCWEKCWVKMDVFFGPNHGFSKKHDWESRFSSMMVFLCLICLAGKPAIVSGISKHLNSFYEYFHICTLFFSTSPNHL